MNQLKRFKQFLIEVWGELKKTTWPGKKEVYGTTFVVIVTVLICATFLWVLLQAHWGVERRVASGIVIFQITSSNLRGWQPQIRCAPGDTAPVTWLHCRYPFGELQSSIRSGTHGERVWEFRLVGYRARLDKCQDRACGLWRIAGKQQVKRRHWTWLLWVVTSTGQCNTFLNQN